MYNILISKLSNFYQKKQALEERSYKRRKKYSKPLKALQTRIPP